MFDLGPKVSRQRRPDVAFISYERWPKGRRIPRTPAWPVIPDLAIEVISTNNSANEVLEKLVDYFGAQVRRVWVVHPLQATIYDYSSRTDVDILLREHTLRGGDVLPGFELALTELFEAEESESRGTS
jgi:Uma2 family endonuclease